MRALGIDSSGLVASVAIVEDETLLAEYTVNYKKTHSQTLLPMLDEIVKMTDFDLSTLDVIAISAGPGSFTGLRIGSATAKGLGLALDKPIVDVPTMEGLAMNLSMSEGLICPMMDARRNEVYTGIYSFTDGRLNIVEDQMAVGIAEITEKLNSYGKPVILLGDGVDVQKDYLIQNLTVPVRFAPAHMNKQHASAVAYLGIQYAKEEKQKNARDHAPNYLRVSQAEREREERLKAQA